MSLRFGHPCVGAGFQRSRNGEIAHFGGPVSANTGKEALLFALQGGLGLWGFRPEVSKRKFRLDTIYAAIVNHGGEASVAEAQYEALSASDQSAIVAFLKTLKMPLIKQNPNPQEAGSPRS